MVALEPAAWIWNIELLSVYDEVALEKLQGLVFSREQKAYKHSNDANRLVNTTCVTKKLHNAHKSPNLNLLVLSHIDFGLKVIVIIICVPLFHAFNIKVSGDWLKRKKLKKSLIILKFVFFKIQKHSFSFFQRNFTLDFLRKKL